MMGNPRPWLTGLTTPPYLVSVPRRAQEAVGSHLERSDAEKAARWSPKGCYTSRGIQLPPQQRFTIPYLPS